MAAVDSESPLYIFRSHGNSLVTAAVPKPWQEPFPYSFSGGPDEEYDFCFLPGTILNDGNSFCTEIFLTEVLII